jgi:hypothetical protein
LSPRNEIDRGVLMYHQCYAQSVELATASPSCGASRSDLGMCLRRYDYIGIDRRQKIRSGQHENLLLPPLPCKRPPEVHNRAPPGLRRDQHHPFATYRAVLHQRCWCRTNPESNRDPTAQALDIDGHLTSSPNRLKFRNCRHRIFDCIAE